MPDDSTDGGTDNPAFSHDEDTSSAGRGSESAACNSSGDEKVVSENGNHSSFVSKHYVEPRKSPEPHFKTETRIEVPDESTDLEKPKQNGHQNGNGNNKDVGFLNTTVTSVSSNDVNDKKEQIEAVNLELVSMKPYSGSNAHQTKNQEACEVPADPYEEYFVPVNEHRKFMRGEKLYVTKDKRSTKSYWKKIVCWGCGFLIIAIIAIIAILAGTGVILTQDDTHPLLNNGKASSRQFNDVQSAGSQEYIKNPPSSPPPATSTFPPWPTTDESLYRHVPKALDGVIKLDDLDWNDDMNNPKSRVYREVVDDLESNLVKMLSLNDVMPIVKVHSISKDGEVKFRVSQPVFEKPQDNQNHLEDKFRQTGSAIGRYHVNRLQISSLINDCYSGNMGCNDSCVYDYFETVFICMCPTGKSFDSNSKKCVDNPESTHTHFGEVGSEEVRGRSRMPDDMYHPESHDWKDSNFDLPDHYQHHHDHTSVEPMKNPEPSIEPPAIEPKAEPEPSAEPKSEVESSSEPQPTEPKAEPEPGTESKSEPEPSSEPQPAAEPTASPEPASEPNSEPEPASEPQPAVEPNSEPQSSGEPQPAAEPNSEPEPASEPQPAAEPKSEPEPSIEPQPNAEPKSEPEPSSEPQPAAEPNSEPEPASEPQPAVEPKSKPEPSSEPQPAAEPKSEPEPASEPQPDAEPNSEPEPSSEPQPAAEPNREPEPASEPQPAAEPKGKPEPSSEPQSAAEPKSEPEPASEPQPDAEPKNGPEPSSEPQPAAESKSEPEPASEPQPDAEPKSGPEPSSEPQPAAEPKSEPEPASEPQPDAEPKNGPEPSSGSKLTDETKSSPEPVVEPKSEPEPASEPQSSVEPSSSSKHVVELKSELKSTSEPQPAAEPKSEPEPASEPLPAAEPKSEPEPASEPLPAAEPKSEPEPASEPLPAAEPKSEPEPTSEPQPAAEPTASSEPKSEPEPTSDIKSESEPSSEPQPTAEPPASPELVSIPKSEPESSSDVTREPKSPSEPISSTTKPVISSSMPSAVISSTSLLSTGDTFESTSQSSETLKTIDDSSIKLSKLNKDTEKNNERDENSARKFSSINSEATTVLNEPAAVIGLNEVPTQLNSENQSSTEKSTDDGSETDVVLGKELVKKGPRLNEDKQDSLNSVRVHVKDVISASGNNEQTNDTKMNVNDSFKHNINLPTNIENSQNHEIKDIGEKNEVSPEEQYNDITDDFVPKGFGRNDIEISNEEKKIQKIYKENKNNNYTKSKLDSELADKLSSKFSTTTQTVEVSDKRVEDPNMTSQIPILPIEIQLEMSTTENADKIYPQTTSQETEKEMISTTSLPTKTTSTEGKTTEQIPILPEELQTTMTNKQEHHTEPTLSIIETNNRTDGLLVVDHKKEEVKEDLRSNENNSSMESTTFKDIVDEDLIEKTTVYNMPSESSIKDTIKPVFESISDDTTPQNFEYKYLLTTTTEQSDSPNGSGEMTEEQLRVIPLEERELYMSKKSDESVKIKKEKELNFNPSSDKETGNNADRKSSRTVEDDNIPKLISGSSSDVDPDEGLKTIFISPDFNGSKPKTVIPLSEKKINSSDTIKYPNFIPVSEEIDESDYHFTESTHSQFHNNHDIATDLPEFQPKEVKNNTDQNLERDVNEAVTELLQAVESSTNKTLLVENSVTKNEIDGNKNKNLEQTSTEENRVIISSTSEPTQPEFLGIPVAVVTSEQEFPKQIFFSKCKSGQFQCVNGTSRDGSYCVDLSSTCDSENDCSDGSDEFDCEKEGCPGNFQCASGQCLKRHLVCNGIPDCDDGSDEKECPNWKCHSDEFQCPKGRCIPVLWQCDGRPDCENHVDEYSCSESCGNDEYLCPTEKWCIPQTWRCNGVPECVNGEDEKLCECAVDQFKCETGGCIPTEQFCDGVENCPDRSDEWNCLSGFSKNSSISTEVDKENKENEFSTKSSPIMIRQSNGEQRYICSDGWTEAFSDQYCRSLGFAASESTQFMDVGTDKKLLQLMTKANPNSTIVLNLEKIDSCNSNKIVEVSCQEFSCGSHESVGPTARLVGGTRATEGQWSSVALLKEPKYGTSCTASIVSPMHALASYSCIYSNRQSGGWQLFVGGNLSKPNKVKNIVPYPQVKYNQFLYNNDIALVELAEPLVFSRNVSAACLPNQSFQPPQLCVTVGWGFPVNGEIGLQQYLKFLPVPTYNSEECNATSHYAGFITKNNICAGFTDTDKGPCYNDEGAPLMCVSETGRWEIQGLLSHHSRCSRGHPAIYSSLAPALSWLRNSVPALQAHS